MTAPDGSLMLAQKDRVLLAGTPDRVRARLAKTWRPPALTGASGQAAQLVRRKPFLAVMSRPSQVAIARIVQETGLTDSAAVDLVSGHEVAGVSLAHDGITWTWQARNPAGHKRALMASEGLLDLLRAIHLFERGSVRVFFAGLRSYAGKSPEIDIILRHEAELLQLMTGITSDGSFRADVRSDPRQRTVTVITAGKKLSDVIPVAAMMSLAGAAVYFYLSESEDQVAGAGDFDVQENQAGDGDNDFAPSRAARKQPAGLDVQQVYRSVKRARGL